jgi:hypothetical protein
VPGQRADLLGSTGGAAGDVPGFAADLVQALGGPGHDVERVRADHRLRGPLAHDAADPAGAIGRHVGEAVGAVGPEGVEEPGDGRGVAARLGPDQVP